MINPLGEIWELLPWDVGEDFSRLYSPVKNGLCHRCLREDPVVCTDIWIREGHRVVVKERERRAVRGESSGVINVNLGFLICAARRGRWRRRGRGGEGPLKVLSVRFTLDSPRLNFSHPKYLQNGPRGKNRRNNVSCFCRAGACGYVGSRHFCVCCGKACTPFRSFAAPSPGWGLALPAITPRRSTWP